MSTVGSVLERLTPDRAPEPHGRAARGRAWLETYGLPDRRDEAWRYTPLDDVVAALDAARPARGAPTSVDRTLVDVVAGDHGGPRLVFVNGAFAPQLSTLDTTPAGVWLGDVEGLRTRRRPGTPRPHDEPVDGFHALNWAAGGDVAAVLVEPEVDAGAPVHIVHLTVPGSEQVAVHPRTVVRVGRGSHLDVIETFAGSGGRSFTNASARILAGEAASVTYRRIAAEPPDVIHIGRTAIEQSARSTVHATSVVTGGAIVRAATDVHLAGVGASVDLDGLYLPTGQQRHDNVITVDHAASGCTSTQRYKGIVDDHARGSFSGHVIVRAGTVGTDARQSNPNLVLAPTAQADTRPWLEIFADDVRCTHGATVGRLDADALFYLRSRGIPREEARRMLIAAFAAEVIDALAPASLRDRVAAAFGVSGIGERR